MLERIFGKKVEFTPVSQSDDCESNSSDAVRQPSNSAEFRYYTLPLFVITALISAVFGAWIGSGHATDIDVFCTKKVSQYCESGFLRLLIGELADGVYSAFDARSGY